MKRLVLLLALTVAFLAAPTGALAKDKHKKHKHHDHDRHYSDRCDYNRSYYSRSYYNDRCNDRYYRPSYSYYRPTYYAPAPVYYSNYRPYYRDYDNCRPVRRSSGVRFVIGF